MVTAEAPEAGPELDLNAPLPNEFGFEYIQLRLPAEWTLTEDILLEICALNEGWNFETTAAGELVIMPGTGFDNTERAHEIAADLVNWKRAGGAGRSGGEAGMVHLPDGILRAPDVCWVSPERLSERPEDYDGVLIPVCPDFVVEIRSQSDSVARQQEKMEQWMAYGVRLGWLIDAYSETVWIYREGQDEPEELDKPAQLSGEDVLPGLVVDMARIWD